MSSIKEIEITTDNSKLFSQREAFNKRWNIIDNSEKKEEFKNRCLTILDDEFHKHSPNHGVFSDERCEYINDYCLEISSNLGIIIKANNFDNFAHKELYSYLKKLKMDDIQDYRFFLFFLQLTLSYDFNDFISNDTLALRFAEAMKICNINAKILKGNDSFDIYPCDVEFLDKPLITDLLSWLNNYPDTKDLFSKAIKTERTSKNCRNIVDDLRVCLELFLKKILNNNKSLENQKSEIGKYFSDNDISKEISNMYTLLIDYYAKYNNHHAKHDNSVVEIEIDYLIYLTGSFIRFVMLIEEQKVRVPIEK